MRTVPVSDLSDSSQTDWWKTGIVYQIYPRSFADSSGDGIGDLAGIEAHLDHLNDGTPQSLGIDAIWLSPIYPSPDFDFGYDVADYLAIDPRFGTLEAFDRLVDGCHRRGIRMILDLVLNHTSHLHPWFVESRRERSGPMSDWYLWADPRGFNARGRPIRPNNWRSWFGGPAWTWDPSRRQFYLHTFLPQQPDLNWRNPDVRRAMLDVVRAWLDRGVDGFRLDVFNAYYKDATLRSNPWRLGRSRRFATWQRHLYDRNQPELEDALRDMRAIIDERPGRMSVGELFDGTLEQAASYSTERHMIFDFTFTRTPWEARRFERVIARRQAVFGDRWPTAVLSNHDQPRHASRYDADAIGDARAKVAATFLLTVRGTPFLYYGEEIALRNLRIPRREAFDPPARRAGRFSGWWNRDQARGPLPWTGELPGAGFTTGRPWLPFPPDVATRNVAQEAADPDSVLAHYRRLIWFRRESAALTTGSQELVTAGDRDVLAYRRVAGDDVALVLLNFANRAARVSVPKPRGESWLVGVSTHRESGSRVSASPFELRPNEALVFLDR